jgi:hypothetical protein
MAKTQDSKRLAAAVYMRKWRKANREKCLAIGRTWQQKNPEKQKYGVHKVRARNRGIPFLLTFEEWWKIWLDSGRWEQRGSRKDQYVMARHEDRGAYVVGNVRICTAAENQSDQALYLREDTRRLRSENAKKQSLTNPMSKEAWKRIMEAKRGQPRSEEVRRKISLAQIGKIISAETRAKLSEAAKAQWARSRIAHD